MNEGIQPDPKAAKLVSDAARATEHFSEDELEAYAEAARQCDHNYMVDTGALPGPAWQCAKCGYVYGPATALRNLSLACYNGACNLPALVRSLGLAIEEVPPGQWKHSVDLKIILGQLSFLVGDSLGPSEPALKHFRREHGL